MLRGRLHRKDPTVFLLALLAACSATPRPADDLAWLVGSWQRAEDDVVTVERWHALPDGTLLGSGSVRTGRVLLFAETMHIAEGASERTFTAWPDGQPPVTFAQVLGGPREVGFENRQHDFPQRLEYRRTEGGLDVRATGVDGDGAPREQRWELVPSP